MLKKMKNLAIILSMLIALFTCNANAQNQLKRYDVKSGIVEYSTTISGKVMVSKVNGNGTEKLFFKDWGAVELKESELTQTTTVKIFGKGKTETENTHTINKLDNGESYFVDFEKEQIYARSDMAMAMTKAFHPDADAGDVGKNMLQGMGGEKIGNEKFLGFNCEVWEFSGGKQWLYKGVMLKIEMKVLGISTVTHAKSARFDINVADGYFKLPNFPVQQEEGFMDNVEYEDDMEDMDANMEKLSQMSFDEWKKLALKDDEEMQEMSDKELRQTYDMIQKMIKLRTGK